MDKKSFKGYLVGYLDDVQGYRVWVPEFNDVVISRDVLFKEERLSTTSMEIETGPLLNEGVAEPEAKMTTNERQVAGNPRETVETGEIDDVDERLLRDRAKLKKPNFFGSPVAVFAESIPTSYAEATISDEAENWKTAMIEEMQSLEENNTWVLVEKPQGRKILNNRWVYRRKPSSDDAEDGYKARLVIKGCSQMEGTDYTETFSPVVRMETLRVIFSVVAREQMHLRQFDIKSAFLYGTLQEEIYMHQPKGFEDNTNRVCKLLKSLYGLKQAPRCWAKHFKDFLSNCGLRESSADPCLYSLMEDKKKLLLALWVDDGLIASSHEGDADDLIQRLKARFKVTITTDVKNFLGIEMHRLHDGSIFISQAKYIRKILERYKMTDSKPVSTPMETGWEASDLSEEDLCVPYREAVGNLMYLQVVTRPDIAYAINIASRALEKPTESHWQLVKRIMRYVKGTEDVGLLYKTSGELKVFSDADFAGDKTTRKSTSGILCKFGDAAVVWQSKKQQCVAQSTTEAEYVSAAKAAKEMVWLTRLMNEIGIQTKNNTLYIDNMSAIKLIKNPEFHQRSKHIDVKYHFVRDLYEKDVLDVTYVQSDDQAADILTKALCKPKFEYMKSLLGLVCKKQLLNVND